MTNPAGSEPSAQAPIQPLKPRRVLFFVLLGALTLWVIALIAMYFLTVRH